MQEHSEALSVDSETERKIKVIKAIQLIQECVEINNIEPGIMITAIINIFGKTLKVNYTKEEFISIFKEMYNNAEEAWKGFNDK